MPRNRFQLIKRFVLCNDKNAMARNCPDRLHKIQYFIKFLKAQFKKLISSQFKCIDE